MVYPKKVWSVSHQCFYELNKNSYESWSYVSYKREGEINVESITQNSNNPNGNIITWDELQKAIKLEQYQNEMSLIISDVE